jgi:hypothetical protein
VAATMAYTRTGRADQAPNCARMCTNSSVAASAPDAGRDSKSVSIPGELGVVPKTTAYTQTGFTEPAQLLVHRCALGV